VLHRFHVLLKIGDSGLGLGHRVTHAAHRLVKADIDLLVIDQRSDRALTVVDLGGNRA
jgi:hypothetical protein